ncbi:MAG: PAS domain-containing protein [Anaerolineae bacterium]|nr:PAS domain-containing protein [Anaerolineae bacterium]
MQIYLLATNLFALAALLLGLGSFIGGGRSWRLLPLFLLVISRSFSLIISLTALERSQVGLLLGMLEVFSAFCIVWALVELPPHWPAGWTLLTWAGGAAALVLTVLAAIPAWPAPAQFHSLIIAVCSTPFILMSAGEVRWSHLAAPFILALANFLNLLGLTGAAWLVNLLAYVFFISAIHGESILAYRRRYAERQQAAEAMVQEAVDRDREHQRWLEVSELLNAIPNLSQSMEHIVRSMAQVIHADQSAVFILDAHVPGQARLVTLYSPQRPLHLSPQDQIVFRLENCPPLQQSIETQEPLLLPQPHTNGLNRLYELWREERSGPTLIQPLLIKGRPVGALLLGNPITSRPIRESDIRLCRNLAPQIATIVEHRRRYLELEAEAEAMAETVQKQAQAPDENLVILETISDGLVVSDAQGRVKLVNQAAERILGKVRWELLDQPIGTIYGEIDSGEPIEDLAVAFARRNQPLPTFFENEERAIQGRLIPWRNQQGEWLGIMAVFRDVTREVKADRARNDFIAALSRELRTPLTSVKGYSDLILQGMLNDYTPEQLHVQQIIHSSADRMVAVLDNAIQISAQNRRKLLPRFEEVNVAQIINDALDEITSLIHLRELKLGRDVPGDLPTITGDPRQIRQILDNLLTNACHFTPPGGRVTLRAEVEQERSGNTFLPRLHLAVADSGVGIPRSEQKRVFDAFYQIKNQSKDVQTGMGMGLAVVKELVELHRGRVWVESLVGEGSTFHVSLPLSQE